MKELSGSRLMLIALVCGLVAAALTIFYLKQVESKYKQAAKPKQQVMVSVVVPRNNLVKGSVLTAKTVASRKIPEAYLPSNAVMAKDFKKIVNRTLKAPVQKGRTLTWAAVTGKAAKNFSGNVELGRRAMSIKVNKIDSFDGLLRPGDHIDLMGTFELSTLGISENTTDSAATSEEVVMPVLENVVVMSAGREDLNGRRYERSKIKNSADGFNMEFTLITLDLNPSQVARLEIAKGAGDLFAVLRNPSDTSEIDYQYRGIDILLEEDKEPNVDLVLDENGNVVGRVVGDNVVDANGNIIGKVVDGKPVTFDGKSLGQIVENVSADDPMLRVAETADVVRDADGNIIGKIVDGQIVDAAGNVVGRVDENGRPVDASGKVLGRVDKGVALDANGNVVDVSKSDVVASSTRREQVVRDADGNVIGRVVNGQVVDANGNVVGTVDASGRAVGLDGKKLGEIETALVDRSGKVVAAEAKVVRDASGKVIGRIVDGKVLDENGNVVGRIDANGNAVGLDGEKLGEIGTALLDKDGKVQGSIDKVVRDANGNVIGRVVNGKVVDADGKVVGVVAEDGAVVKAGKAIGEVETVVRDADGNIIGRVVDGQVIDENGNVIGRVDKDGTPIGLDGQTLGTVEQVVRDKDGNVIGRVVDGKVLDENGKVIGVVGEDGVVREVSDEVLGQVETVVTDANGRAVSESVEIVRDADGNVIGKIVDGKVIDADGKVIGEVKDGKVVDANGKVIAEGVSVDATSAVAADAALQASQEATSVNDIKYVDFISGGSAEEGIIPVKKVRLE